MKAFIWLLNFLVGFFLVLMVLVQEGYFGYAQGRDEGLEDVEGVESFSLTEVRSEGEILMTPVFLGSAWRDFYRIYVVEGERLAQAARVQGVFFAKGAVAGIFGARWRLGSGGLPRNSRQVSEGYWIGSQPGVEHMEELWARGVRGVLSATVLSREVSDFMDSKGMVHIDVRFGGKFPRRKPFLEAVKGFRPDELFIHCEHGGDRTGSLLAYLLVRRHDWNVAAAFLSVAIPSQGNLAALIDILEMRGFPVDEETLQVAGLYSAELNGGFGGLKAQGRSYYRMINTTIDAIRREMKAEGRAF